MLSRNVNNISRPQSSALNSSSLSTQSASEASPKPSHALCENLPKRQQESAYAIQTNPSDNIPVLSASSIPSATDSSSKYLVEQRIEAAQEALSEIRKRIPGKSTNKSYGDTPPPERSELYRQPALTDRFNAWREAPTKSSIDKVTVANCEDLSILAWQSLMDKTCKKGKSQLGSIDLVEWLNEHLCVVLGQPSIDGKFPDEFSEWEKDAVICDVWANIVCKATDFPKAWREKMEKWDRRGLKIDPIYDDSLIDGQWVPVKMESPVSKEWLALPEMTKVRGYISYANLFYRPIYKRAASNGYYPSMQEMHKSAVDFHPHLNKKNIA